MMTLCCCGTCDHCLETQQARKDARNYAVLFSAPVAHRRGWFEARAYALRLMQETGREHVVMRQESTDMWGIWEAW